MEEKMETLYQEYLKEKLDLVFNIDSDKIIRMRNKNQGEAEPNVTIIRLDNRLYNIADTHGNILSEESFKNIYPFEDGYALVYKEGEYNYIDTHGKLLSEKWFFSLGKFCEGYAKVTDSNLKYNFIDRQAKILCKIWFDEATDFSTGIALVKRNQK